MQAIGFAQILLRRWWIFVVFAGVGFGLTYQSSGEAPKRYESVVTLQLNPAARGGLLGFGGDPSRSVGDLSTMAASYSEVLRSRAFGQVVVDQLNLDMSPESVGGSIVARLIPNTNVFRITVTRDNPQDARRLAQGVAEVFIAENLRRQQVDPGQQSRLDQIDDLLRVYPSRLEALRRQRDQFDDAVASGDITKLNELNNLDSRINGLEASYASLLVEANRARSSFDTATILDSASVATPVASLPRNQTLFTGVLGGLAVAAVIALLLEQLDHRLRHPGDIVAISDSAPLTVIGRISTRKWLKEHRDSHLVALHAPRTPAAEAFRMLRTNLRFAQTEHPVKTMIVTSSGESEGKTLVASNFAITLAQGGLRVLLIDADFRRPSVHKVFGVDRHTGSLEDIMQQSLAREFSPEPATAVAQNGAAVAARPTLTGALQGVQSLVGGLGQNRGVAGAPPPSANPSTPAPLTAEQIVGVIPSGVEGLYLLPVSHSLHDPTPVLGSEAFAGFIRRVAGHWDMVIIDTPPIGPVADALLAAATADAALIVARAGRTSRAAARRTLEALRRTGKPVLGFVLNDYRPEPLSKYSTSGYYYHYGGYYYSQADDEPKERKNGRSKTRATA